LVGPRIAEKREGETFRKGRAVVREEPPLYPERNIGGGEESAAHKRPLEPRGRYAGGAREGGNQRVCA